MINVAVRVREILSSNIETALAHAADRDKMRRLLRREIEEKLISLKSDSSRLHRETAQGEIDARRASTDAEGWTDKAKTAMDHGREDLARQALMAREVGRQKAKALNAAVEAMKVEGAEIADMISGLEAKHAELVALAPAPQAATASAPRTDRALSRIEELENRIELMNAGKEPEAADIEAEIAALSRDREIETELAEMRSGGEGAAKAPSPAPSPTPKKKAAPRRKAAAK